MLEIFPTILLIEDDQSTRELYQRELSRDFHVLACTTQSEALNFLQGGRVRAIVVEPALYNGEGWTFLATLQSMSRLPTIPIIICSTLDDERRGLDLGATLYLIKPVLPAVLLDVIHQVTRNLTII